MHTSIPIAGSLNELTQPPETVPYHLGASGCLLAILSPPGNQCHDIAKSSLLRSSKLLEHYYGGSLSLKIFCGTNPMHVTILAFSCFISKKEKLNCFHTGMAWNLKMTIYFHNETNILVFYPKLQRKCLIYLINRRPAKWIKQHGGIAGTRASSGQNLVL